MTDARFIPCDVVTEGDEVFVPRNAKELLRCTVIATQERSALVENEPLGFYEWFYVGVLYRRA